MKTRVITIKGDGDFNVLDFEDRNLTPKQAWEHAMSLGGEYTVETDEVFYKVKAYEFDAIDPAFIDLANDFKDYDQAKAEDWIVVPNEDPTRKAE